MPELPDIDVYVERLSERIHGADLTDVRLNSPFLLRSFDPPLDLECTPEVFGQQLRRENRSLKRALTSPRIFSGIGNAYSDEIPHAARILKDDWPDRL